MQITEVRPRTAANILAHADRLEQDDYHREVVLAAQWMVNNGKAAWFYQTQYKSGATLWVRLTEERYYLGVPSTDFRAARKGMDSLCLASQFYYARNAFQKFENAVEAARETK